MNLPRWFLLLPLFLLMTGAAPQAAPVRPNFIVILTDDQDLTLGSLQHMPRTRALIGGQGMTFSSYFVPLSLCCPSRSTILTGLYPHNHEVLTNFPPEGGFERFAELGREDTTIAAALHAAGYRTALIGKYLNGYPGEEGAGYIPPGWDEWASPVAGSPYSAYRYTLNENGTSVRYGSTAQDYATDVLAGKAVDFVRRASGSGKPFFLYFATYAPHRPATPAPRHVGLFPDLLAPRTPSFNEGDVRDKPAQIRRLPRLKKAQIDEIDALYRRQMRALQAVDEAVAALVEALREKDQLANTYIVFTSDNGFHMGQHRLTPGKYTPYETDIHVPLLVRGPGIPAGRTAAALAVSVDLAPTLADLAGVTFPADGRSLAPVLRGETPAVWRQRILLEQFALPPAPPRNSELLEPAYGKEADPYPAHAGFRTADTKYIEYGTGEREVYNLRTDPDERGNLAARMTAAWLEAAAKTTQALKTCKGETCRTAEDAP